MRRFFLPPLALLVGLLACVRSQPQVIVVTATPPPGTIPAATPTLPVSTATLELGFAQGSPTPDPTRPAANIKPATQYVVQPGDTLYAIAESQGVSLESLLAVNSLIDPNVLTVGQVLNLPETPGEATSDFKIIPDSRLVRGPNSSINIAAFINEQPGYIRQITDNVNDRVLTAAEVIERVSLEFSVDARLLLALLEFRAGWLSNPNPPETAKMFPMESEAPAPGFDRSGLYRQLGWAANRLNAGYYGWRYRGLSTIEFEDGTRLRYAPGLNAATVGVQYFLSQNNDYYTWKDQISAQGFYEVYRAYFGDPFVGVTDPLVPAGIQQPTLALPFSQGETWFFTGGPHGGWGSGSAWSAIDFAPPDDLPEGNPLCYVSEFWATAVAPGVIARADEGSVILDLDGDGDESTGWTILYLHIASEGRIQAGTRVQIGDRIGHPSCEGGFSNATHMHLARRYNGEWIPTDCEQCPPGFAVPPFVLSGWTVFGFTNQEYQGYMLKGGERRNAEQGRLSPENRVSW